MWGDAMGNFSLCGCAVEYTPGWVGTSDLHGTEGQDLGCDLELVCDEAVLWRGYVVIGT